MSSFKSRTPPMDRQGSGGSTPPEQARPKVYKTIHPMAEFKKRFKNIRSKSKIEHTPNRSSKRRGDRSSSVASESSSSRHEEDSANHDVDGGHDSESEIDDDEDDRVLQLEANRDNMTFKVDEAYEKLDNLQKKYESGVYDERKYNKKRTKYVSQLASAKAKIEEINKNLEAHMTNKASKRAKLAGPSDGPGTGTLMQGFFNKMSGKRPDTTIRPSQVASTEYKDQSDGDDDEEDHSPPRVRRQGMANASKLSTELLNPTMAPTGEVSKLDSARTSLSSMQSYAPQSVHSSDPGLEMQKTAALVRLKQAMVPHEAATPTNVSTPSSSRKDKRRIPWSQKKDRTARNTPLVNPAALGSEHIMNTKFFAEVQDRLGKLLTDTIELTELSKNNEENRAQDMQELRDMSTALEHQTEVLNTAQAVIETYDEHINKQVRVQAENMMARLDQLHASIHAETAHVAAEIKVCEELQNKVLKGDEKLQRHIDEIQGIHADYQKRPSALDSLLLWASSSMTNKAALALFCMTFGGLVLKSLIAMSSSSSTMDDSMCQAQLQTQLEELHKP